MAFHRLSVPSYFGGLPGGYDYANNALSGTPAFADGAKAGGPNSGTYFIAFGEDATSADANRPAKALAENTDFLDDLMRRDIALPVRTTDATAGGGGVSSIVLTGPGIFLGLGGALLADLFHIASNTDEDLDVAGAKVVVTSITGGTIGTGFSSGNITLTLNVAIPSGVSYHVYYGQRTNLATIPADGFTNMRMRTAVGIDFETEELFRQLHGNNEAFNAAWDSTIFDLTARGLDGGYRRSTTAGSLTGPFNVAGSGGTIVRDGSAPAAVSLLSLRSTGQVDSFKALWAAFDSEVSAGAALTTDPMGSMGFVHVGHRWAIQGEGGSGTFVPSQAAFASYSAHRSTPVAGSPASAGGYATKVPPLSTATVAAAGPAGVYNLILTAAGTYWWSNVGGVQQTALSIGHDLIEISLIGGARFMARVRDLTLADTNRQTIQVTGLDGGPIQEIPGGTTAVLVTWVQIQHAMYSGGANAKGYFTGSGGIGSSSGKILDGLFVVAPPTGLTSNVTDTHTAPFGPYKPYRAAYFGACPPVSQANIALSWGTLETDVTQSNYGFWREYGMLNGDGSISVTGITATNDVLFETDALVGGTLGVTGVSTFGDVTVNGITNFFGAVETLADVTVARKLIFSGPGHVVWRRYEMTDASQTIGVASGSVQVNGADVVRLNSGTMTGPHNVTVTSTGATDGSWMRFYCSDAANTHTLKQDSGATICLLRNDGTQRNTVDLISTGAANGWEICGDSQT